MKVVFMLLGDIRLLDNCFLCIWKLVEIFCIVYLIKKMKEVIKIYIREL